MASSNNTMRPTVFVKKDLLVEKVIFNKCLLDVLGRPDKVAYTIDKDGNIILQNICDKDHHERTDVDHHERTGVDHHERTGVLIRHPPSCPLHEMSIAEVNSIPTDRSISVGVTVYLTSSNGYTLLTRRSKHLSLFPGLWVLPGGHVEKDETMLEAALRELHEETGIFLSTEEYQAKELFLFESCYPSFKELGLPKRRHVILIYHIATKLTLSSLQQRVKLQEEETDSCVWLHDSVVRHVANGNDKMVDDSNISEQLNILKSNITYTTFKPSILFNRVTDVSTYGDEEERLSTSTYMAFNIYSDKTEAAAVS